MEKIKQGREMKCTERVERESQAYILGEENS